MNLLQPERLERLSREYVLGTLTGRARRRFERLLTEAPLAGRVVARWQQRFDVLAAGVPPVQPRDHVWQGLQQRLFASREKPAAPSFWARVQALPHLIARLHRWHAGGQHVEALLPTHHHASGQRGLCQQALEAAAGAPGQRAQHVLA